VKSKQPPAPYSSHLTPHFPHSGTVLCFDFGLKRIGVAVGEIELGTVHR